MGRITHPGYLRPRRCAAGLCGAEEMAGRQQLPSHVLGLWTRSRMRLVLGSRQRTMVLRLRLLQKLVRSIRRAGMSCRQMFPLKPLALTLPVPPSLCSAEFTMSSNFQGQSPRCPACRASGVEWKQAWLTTVWFRSLGLSLGNKPHTEAPPAMKMAVRVRLWALQATVRDALDLPDFKIRTFATALSDEQKLGVAEQVEAFL